MSPLDPKNPVAPARKPRAAEAPPSPVPPTPPASDPVPYGVPPVLTEGPNVGALVRALGRRWLRALVVGVGGAALFAFAMMQAFPAPYTAETRLVLRRPPNYMPDSGDNGVGFEEYMRNQ